MVPALHDVFDTALFEQMLDGRYIKVTPHPHLDLRILNYTSKAQFDRMWNAVTRTCRGLIVDADDRIVARPFGKFFNVGEHNGPLPGGPVTVSDKLDGSLGILYPAAEGYAVATRGSFVSDQADHATKVFTERYADQFDPDPQLTYLFEVIYPANRIVVDYGRTDDLVLLGAVDIASGISRPLGQVAGHWPGPVADVLPHSSLEEALAAEPRPNAEGLVVHFHDQDLRLKLKQDDYVRLHRLMTGVSERRVWEALSSGEDLAAWLDNVPDEFYDFVIRTRNRLLREYDALVTQVRSRYDLLVGSLPADHTRKQFAEQVLAMRANWPLAPVLFAHADGKDYSRTLWQQLRPREHVPLFAMDEDTN